jgi:hypothetical protein
VQRGHETLRKTSGGCLTGMQHVHGREGGETGGARLRPGAPVEPRDNTVEIDGRGGRDVLQMRFREPPIPRAAEPKRTHPLGARAFDPCAVSVLPLTLFTRIPGLGSVQSLGLRPGVEFEPTFKGSECPCRFFELRARHTTRSRGPVRHRPAGDRVGHPRAG